MQVRESSGAGVQALFAENASVPDDVLAGVPVPDSQGRNAGVCGRCARAGEGDNGFSCVETLEHSAPDCTLETDGEIFGGGFEEMPARNFPLGDALRDRRYKAGGNCQREVPAPADCGVHCAWPSSGR